MVNPVCPQSPGHVTGANRICFGKYFNKSFGFTIKNRRKACIFYLLIKFWLMLSVPLGSGSTRTLCETCGNPMVLLLQIYTAENFPLEAFHRYIYLLICPKGVCHKVKNAAAKSMRLFRSQLPLQNKYFTTNVEEGTAQIKQEFKMLSNTCFECGMASSICCEKCKCFFCSELHSNAVSHNCSKIKNKCFVFPESEILCEPESNLKVKYSATVDEETDDTPETECGIDKAFLKFEKRVAYHPDQVIRYLRSEEEGEITENHPRGPLFVSDDSKYDLKTIPNCPRCGSKRTLECQVLSTIIHYLKIDNSNTEAIDFGTLFLFTCPENCVLDGEYGEEYIYRQDFSLDGAK